MNEALSGLNKAYPGLQRAYQKLSKLKEKTTGRGSLGRLRSPESESFVRNTVKKDIKWQNLTIRDKIQPSSLPKSMKLVIIDETKKTDMNKNIKNKMRYKQGLSNSQPKIKYDPNSLKSGQKQKKMHKLKQTYQLNSFQISLPRSGGSDRNATEERSPNKKYIAELSKVLEIDGVVFYVNVHFGNKNLLIVAEILGRKLIKAIEIERVEASEFIMGECNGNLSNIFTHLRYDNVNQVLYLVAEGADFIEELSKSRVFAAEREQKKEHFKTQKKRTQQLIKGDQNKCIKLREGALNKNSIIEVSAIEEEDLDFSEYSRKEKDRLESDQSSKDNLDRHWRTRSMFQQTNSLMKKMSFRRKLRRKTIHQ